MHAKFIPSETGPELQSGVRGNLRECDPAIAEGPLLAGANLDAIRATNGITRISVSQTIQPQHETMNTTEIIDQLNAALTTRDQEIHDKTCALVALQGQYDAACNTINSLNTQTPIPGTVTNPDWSAELNALKAERDSLVTLRSTWEDQSAEIVRLNTVIGERNDRIAELTAQLASLNQSIDAAQGQA